MSKTNYEDLVIENYSLAPSGQGPLASEWEDKPHRLVYDLCSALTSLLKERDKLKEALKPFAEASRGCGPGIGDCVDFAEVLHDGDPAEFTVGDLRRARAALNGE